MIPYYLVDNGSHQPKAYAIYKDKNYTEVVSIPGMTVKYDLEDI